ncbi:MAG: hypothetical protein PF443_09325 [Allgaiera sp.]|jgi:hypothetical protein|nr:hypothetical protein [Allgaiera sp.]
MQDPHGDTKEEVEEYLQSHALFNPRTGLVVTTAEAKRFRRLGVDDALFSEDHR